MIKEKLEEAYLKKENDINSFVWKGRKVEIAGQLIQEEKRLVDCSEQELKEHYTHCKSMLYNESKDYPGRYVLLEIIEDQRKRCNVELFLNWLENERHIPRFTFMGALRKSLDENKDYLESVGGPKGVLMNNIVGECPADFGNVDAEMALEGCMDRLGKFNRQHITLTFILKQGLWFTAQESKEMVEKNAKGELRDKIEVAKERLNLRPTLKLYTTPKGLTFAQMRSMVNLKSKKYSELSVGQLEVLRNRILFALEDDVRFHIKQWETRMNQIQKVCDAKGITL